MCWRSNIVGALDSPDRQLAFLMPCHREKGVSSREVWKLDLHTSEVMRNGVKTIMTANQAATAMGIWVEILRVHLSMQLTPDCIILHTMFCVPV